MFIEEFNLTRPCFSNCFVLENEQKLLFISMENGKGIIICNLCNTEYAIGLILIRLVK